MDPARNPYTPGAGMSPVVLAGRANEIAEFGATLTRLTRGRSAQNTLIVGLRGVGKTVLLSQFRREAVQRSWIVVEHETAAGGDLLGTIARLSRDAMLTLAPPSAWTRAGRRVSSVLRALEVTYQLAGLSLAVSAPETAEDEFVATGDPARDVTELLVSLGTAAREQESGVAFLFDELQYAPSDLLGAFITGLHKLAQRELPVTMVAAGLPQTRGVLAQAATYSERMFQVRTVGPLVDDAAREALARPAAEEGASIDDAALDIALEFTDGYPYFLQVFGDRVWRLASGDRITIDDAAAAQPLVRADLDAGFFTFRSDGLPVTQRRYLRAMAELGPGEHASGDIASMLGLTSSANVGQTREALIRRGLIYSPRLGFAEFTVPQFDDYLRRHFELESHRPRRRRPSDG